MLEAFLATAYSHAYGLAMESRAHDTRTDTDTDHRPWRMRVLKLSRWPSGHKMALLWWQQLCSAP